MATIFGLVIGIAIGSLFYALIVQLCCYLFFKFKTAYGTAYKAVLVANLLSVLVGYLVGASAGQANDEVILGSSAAGLVIGAFVLGAMIEHPTKGNIGFLRGALLVIVPLVVVIGILVASGV